MSEAGTFVVVDGQIIGINEDGVDDIVDGNRRAGLPGHYWPVERIPDDVMARNSNSSSNSQT